MFICEKCGEIFVECGTHYEHHPYGMSEAIETWDCCPRCDSLDITDAVKCKICGKWHAETDFDDVCNECAKEVMQRFYNLILENFDDNERDFIAENVEVEKI
jgi:hypothetical protein